MVRSKGLIFEVHRRTGVPIATVDQHYRRLHAAGLVTQSGHGKAAAEMTERDAFRLLLSVAIDLSPARGAELVPRFCGLVLSPYTQAENTFFDIIKYRDDLNFEDACLELSLRDDLQLMKIVILVSISQARLEAHDVVTHPKPTATLEFVPPNRDAPDLIESIEVMRQAELTQDTLHYFLRSVREDLI